MDLSLSLSLTLETESYNSGRHAIIQGIKRREPKSVYSSSSSSSKESVCVYI